MADYFGGSANGSGEAAAQPAAAPANNDEQMDEGILVCYNPCPCVAAIHPNCYTVITLAFSGGTRFLQSCDASARLIPFRLIVCFPLATESCIRGEV